jgi:hypothetical protein
MEDIFRIVFQGNTIDRDTFLSNNFMYPLVEFLEKSIHKTASRHFAMFAKEIVKNIYDHADGLGEATFEKIGDSLKFEIKDYGTQAYDLDKLKAGGTTKDTNYNKGIGLKMMIPDMAESLGIGLKIDCSCGFTYTGTWNHLLYCNSN